MFDQNVPFNVIDGCQDGEVLLTLNGIVDFEIQEFYSFTLKAEVS